MKHKPAPTQRQLEFGQRRKALRKFWPAVDSNVKHLIRVLEDFCGLERDVCWPSRETIAFAMNCSPATVSRCIKRAEEKGLLIVIQRRTKTFRAATYKISRATYQELANLSPANQQTQSQAQVENANCDLNPKSPRLNLRPQPEIEGAICDMNLAGSRLNLQPQPEVEVASCNDPCRKLQNDLLIGEVRIEEPTSTEGVTWQKVEKAVRDFGLADWREPIAVARSAGCTPDQVLALVAAADRRRGDWRPEAAPGVLHRRLRNAHPSTDPETGWPPASPEIARQRLAEATRDADRRRRAAEAEAEQRAAAGRAAEATRLSALESRFGRDLDAMPETDRDALVLAALASKPLIAAAYRRRRTLDPLIRQIVLAHLEREAVTANGT